MKEAETAKNNIKNNIANQNPKEKDITGLLSHVNKELTALYLIKDTAKGPSPACLAKKIQVQARMPRDVMEHLLCIDLIVDYLAQFIPAIQKSESLIRARYDVMSLIMQAVNNFLDAHVLPWLSNPHSQELSLAQTR